jgi:hypothetical protein
MKLTTPASIALAAVTVVGGGAAAAVLLVPEPARAEDPPAATGDCPAPLAHLAGAIGIPVEDLRAALRDGRTLAEVAEANSVDPQVVVDAMVARGTARLDAAVAAGHLDQATADSRKARLPVVAADIVSGGLDRGDRAMRARRAAALTTAADAIGVPVEDLRASLRDGQSVAQVAEANGVEPQAVVDALAARATTRITRWVGGDGPRRHC